MDKLKPQEITCTVSSKKMIANGVFELKFNIEPTLPFQAGQFISIVIPNASPSGRDLRRAYSIASSPHITPLELCITQVKDGPGTTYLYSLNEGDTFKAFFPYGDFVYKPKKDQNVCFIATGTGIAPFRAMMYSKEFQAHPPKKIYCLYGARNCTDILYESELKSYPNSEWFCCLSRETGKVEYFIGRVTQKLKELDGQLDWSRTDFYLCGNGAMIKEVEHFLKEEKGVEKHSFHKEAYFQPKV